MTENKTPAKSFDNPQSGKTITHRPENAKADVSIAMASSAKKGVNRGVKAVANVYTDFKEFLDRGNVFDLAIGVIMGAAFTAVVQSMVKDIFTPFISLGLDQVSLENSFVVLACPKLANSTNSKRQPRSTCSSSYSTVLQANTSGAITWNYGAFIGQIITFLVTASIVYFIVKMYCAAFRRKKAEETEKDCLLCLKKIPIKATRCAFCTSSVPEYVDLNMSGTSEIDDESKGKPKRWSVFIHEQSNKSKEPESKVDVPQQPVAAPPKNQYRSFWS